MTLSECLGERLAHKPQALFPRFGGIKGDEIGFKKIGEKTEILLPSFKAVCVNVCWFCFHPVSPG